MSTLELAISPAVAARFPEIAVAGLVVRGLDRAVLPPSPSPAELAASLATSMATDGVAEHPAIAPWRRAIAECGLKPSEVRGSVEQLCRRALKGTAVESPSRLVEHYCAVSVLRLAPLGAYDLDRLPAARIELREGRPGRDRFEPLGSRPQAMPIGERVVVYAAGDEVLCWAFNVRDSRATCLLPATRDALFVAEAVDAEGRGRAEAALADLAGLLAEAGALPGEIRVADAARPATTLAWSG